MRNHPRRSFGLTLTLAALVLGVVPRLLAAPLVVEGDTIKLDEFAVAGSRPEAYTAAHADSSSKLPISIFENPQNIQVVPRSLLADQGALKLDDVLKNVAGVTPGGYYSNWDYYRIRGFDAAFNTFIDGLRHHSGMGEELFGLEQVEIVKQTVGAIAGDMLTYALGRLVGVRRLQATPFRPLARMLRWAGRRMGRRTGIVVLTARFIPFARLAVNLTAGSTGIALSRFAPFSLAAGLAWAVYNVAMGALAGRWFASQPLLGMALAIVLAVAFGFILDAVTARLRGTRRAL